MSHPTTRGGRLTNCYTKAQGKIPACFLFVMPDGSFEWSYERCRPLTQREYARGGEIAKEYGLEER